MQALTELASGKYILQLEVEDLKKTGKLDKI